MQQKQTSYPHQIHTFGSLQIYNANAPLTLKGEKSINLLAYLVLHPRIAHRRERLADMLWPDAPPERVRRNLSDVLFRLQKTIDPGWLMVDDVAIAFQPNANVWVDVWEFDSLIVSKDNIDLEKAVELYAGDLLPEIYEDWILAERELRRSQYLSVLEAVSAHYGAQGKLQPALLYARRLILTEPLHEPAHQVYLRLLGRLKRFSEALVHYDYLCTLLRSELDSKPTAETDAIIHSLLRERDIENEPSIFEETSPFVGRKTERAAALAVVEAMLKGNGSLLAVEGEAGIGKSRLLREIASGARWRGATVLHGQASEIPSASPFSPLIEALKPLVDGPHGKQLEVLLNSEKLALLAPINPAWSAKPVAFDDSYKQESRHFYDALNIFGETLARLAPVVLILDDLQWADAVLWECLRSFAPGFARQGGLLILAYRRVDIENLPGWNILQAWDRDGYLKTISLEPFDIDEVAQLIGETANVDPAEIRAWSGGNPFFINDWLTYPDSKRSENQIAISYRLSALSPNAKVALESASVLGENIPYQIWIEISELSPVVLAGLSDELMARQWIQPSTIGYAFTHDLIRSAVYDEMESSLKRKLHERAANAYLTHEPGNLRGRAYHLDQAGLVVDAAKVYRLAGEQDLARFAFHEAQVSFDRALTLAPKTESTERVEIALALAQASHPTGDRDRQELALKEALAGAQESSPQMLRALLLSGRFASQTGQSSDAKIKLESALALAKSLKDQTREIEVILTLAEHAREQSHWSDAQGYYDQALILARHISNSLYEARALKGIGFVFSDQGLPYQSIPWIEKAIAVYRRIGNTWQMAQTQSGLIGIFAEVCEWDKLLAMANEAIPNLESSGDRQNVAVARHNLALAYRALGSYVEARTMLEKNLLVFESIRSRRALGVTQLVLGEVAEDEKKYDLAISLFRLALANAESVESLDGIAAAQCGLGSLFVKQEQPLDAIPLLEAALISWVEQENTWEQNHTEAVLGLALLMFGERTRAEELVGNGWKFFQAGAPMGEKPQKWLWSLYRLLVGLNQSDRAQEILRAAYEELQRQSKNVSDPIQKRGFFESVAENRAIVNAYDQLVGGPRVISVSLAHRDVPLGRTLRKDEYVTVRWSLNAPEDNSILDKSERRLYRLKRLLDEAENQGGAPTDDDLAQALGVSRRTILRDMQSVSKEIPKPPTRKRKSN